jgi:mgtE-like transporter
LITVSPERAISIRVVFRIIMPLFLLTLLFDFVGGAFLGAYFEKLMIHYPAILIILPGLMGLRGNVFGSLGSRISTRLYIGDLEPSIKERHISNNILLSIVASSLPAFILWLISVIKLQNPALDALEIVISSSVFIGLILGIATAWVVILAFRKRVDPDNVAGPAITTIADMISIPGLIVFIILFEKFSSLVHALFILILIFLIASTLNIWKFEERSIAKEVFTIVTILAVFQSFTGATLQTFSQIIYSSILLSFAYPAIIGSLGNYGSIVAARTSTKLHLGEVTGRITGSDLREILSFASISPILSVLIITLSWLLAFLSGLPVESLIYWKIILIFASVYVPLSIAIMLLSYHVSVLLYKRRIDPDNGGIPAITTIADLAGTFAIILIAYLIIKI